MTNFRTRQVLKIRKFYKDLVLTQKCLENGEDFQTDLAKMKMTALRSFRHLCRPTRLQFYSNVDVFSYISDPCLAQRMFLCCPFKYHLILSFKFLLSHRYINMNNIWVMAVIMLGLYLSCAKNPLHTLHTWSVFFLCSRCSFVYKIRLSILDLIWTGHANAASNLTGIFIDMVYDVVYRRGLFKVVTWFCICKQRHLTV